MMEWWESLNLLQKVFSYLAIPATLVLAIQSVMVLFGFGEGEGADLDGDSIPDSMEGLDSGDGLALFTVRGLVAFFAVGGWTGIALGKTLWPVLTIAVAFLAGAAAMVGIALLLRAMNRLQASGTLDLHAAVGLTGRVYLTVPVQGCGKVNLTLQGRFCELDAMTQGAEPIPSGTAVKVTGLLDGQTLIVERAEVPGPVPV